MTSSQEHDHFGRHPKLWTINAVHWKLENPDYKREFLLGGEIEDPAKELEMTEHLEDVEAPDLEHALAAAHQLLDRHAHQAGEFALEIWVIPPQLPHADQERLGVPPYKLDAEVRTQARAIGIRGNVVARVSRMVRHAVPFEHEIANRRFGGIIMRVEDDAVTWIGLATPPRRRRRKAK